jgi:hypothetical protein
MRSPIAHSRIFVALTLAEAAAIGRLPPGPDPDAVGGVAKIQRALDGARAPDPQPSAPSPTNDLPGLRAKHYDPRGRQRPMAKATLPAKRPTTVSIDTAPAKPVDVDYVPFRDEADGRWR